MELWHSERGGMRKGKNYLLSMNFSWPFAKIEVYREMIVLKYFFGRLQLEKHEIDSIEEFKIGIARGIKINHNRENLSPFIVFFSFSIDNLFVKLEETGYKIKISE